MAKKTAKAKTPKEKTAKAKTPKKKTAKANSHPTQDGYKYEDNLEKIFTIPENGKKVIGSNLPPYVQINLTTK